MAHKLLIIWNYIKNHEWTIKLVSFIKQSQIYNKIISNKVLCHLYRWRQLYGYILLGIFLFPIVVNVFFHRFIIDDVLSSC
jgi:hypothetical protein